MLRNELEDYEELASEARDVLGPIGKPLRNKFIASWLKEKIEEGEPPEETLPETVIEIIEKIENLR